MNPKFILKPKELLSNIDKIFCMKALILILILVVQISFGLSAFASEIPLNQCKCDFGHYYDGGTCVLETEPLLCTDNFEPVCGCDGIVYSNSCGAQISGVKVFTKGLCSLSSGFTGRWKARTSTSRRHYNMRFFVKDSSLNGFINGKKIPSDSTVIRSVDSVSINMRNKKFELKLINEKELSVLLEDGIMLKARRVN